MHQLIRNGSDYPLQSVAATCAAASYSLNCTVALDCLTDVAVALFLYAEPHCTAAQAVRKPVEYLFFEYNTITN